MVKLGDYTSDSTNVSFGVPQGSVLGPTLFLIYLNDLCNMAIKNAKIFSYADDTAVVFTGDSWEKVRENAEKGLEQIGKWLCCNLLTLNTAKSNYVCFSINNNTQPETNFEIKIHTCNNERQNCHCPTIQKVAHTKYLGVLVDQRLSWYPHLEYVILRLRKLTWIFKTLRHVVPRADIEPGNMNRGLLRDIYVALVQSILIYCVPVWGGASKTRFLEIERAQRSLLKVMFFKKKRFPTETLYQISRLLSVRKLYILQTTLKKHKTITYDPIKATKRRQVIIDVPKSNTVFATRQYVARSSYLYKTINKFLNIYGKPYFESKRLLQQWLETKYFEETEALLDKVK